MIEIKFGNLSFGKDLNIPESGEIVIEVKGHSGTGTKGNDIICAAISALFQTLVLSVFRILKIDQDIERDDSGYMSSLIKIDALEKDDLMKLKLLIESFILGTSEISREYPGTVKIDIERH